MLLAVRSVLTYLLGGHWAFWLGLPGSGCHKASSFSGKQGLAR